MTEGKLFTLQSHARSTLSAGAGSEWDALLLLPQTAEMDRAAMNLFQNYTYAPWRNPF